MSVSPGTDSNSVAVLDKSEPPKGIKKEPASSVSDPEKASPGEKECDKEQASAPEVDKKALKEQFEAYGKFGDKAADGKTIKLSQSDKWFKQAKVIDGKTITTTDTGIAFRKISKKSPKLTFTDWNKYLDEIATSKKQDSNALKGKLVECGKPGFTGATKVSQNSAMERLTDSSTYGGTHKQRFTPDGKGKGKEGRVDAKPSAFRENKGNSRA